MKEWVKDDYWNVSLIFFFASLSLVKINEPCQKLCWKKNISDMEEGPQLDVQRAFEPPTVWPFPPSLDCWAFADFMRSFRPQQWVPWDHRVHTTHQQQCSWHSSPHMFSCEDKYQGCNVFCFFVLFLIQTLQWPMSDIKRKTFTIYRECVPVPR